MVDKKGLGFILFSWDKNKRGVIVIIISGVIFDMKEIGISGIGVRTIQLRIDPPSRAPEDRIIMGIVRYLSVSMWYELGRCSLCVLWMKNKNRME